MTYIQEVMKILELNGRYDQSREVNPYIGKALTSNELNVLRMIAQGETNKSMAYIEKKSIKTIEKQRTTMMRKLGLYCIADLTQYALAIGLCGNKFGGRQ